MGVVYCRHCDGVMGATQVRRTLAEWIREAGIHTCVWVLAVPLTGLGTSGKSLNAFGHHFLHLMTQIVPVGALGMEGELMWARGGCPIRGASSGIQIGRQVQTSRCPREGAVWGWLSSRALSWRGNLECLTLGSDPEKAASCSFEARVGSGE